MIEGSLPCTQCGSYDDECSCQQDREVRLLQQALGLHLDRPLTYYERWRANAVRIDNDLAATWRALREAGYDR